MPSAGFDKPHDVVKEEDLIQLNLFFFGYITLLFFKNQLPRTLLQFLGRFKRNYLLWLWASSH